MYKRQLVDRQPYIEKLKGTWTWDSTGIAVGLEAQKLYRLESAEGKENRRFEAIVKLWRGRNEHSLTGLALVKSLGAMSIGGGKQSNLERSAPGPCLRGIARGAF